MYLCVARPISEYVPIGRGTLYLSAGEGVQVFLVPVGAFPITQIEVRHCDVEAEVWFESEDEVSH